jgi:hypothetical protein
LRADDEHRAMGMHICKGIQRSKLVQHGGKERLRHFVGKNVVQHFAFNIRLHLGELHENLVALDLA